MITYLDQPKSKITYLDDAPRVVEHDAIIPPKPSKFGSLAKSFAIGGAPGFSVTPGSEDVLPTVGQTVGGVFGGFGGSVAGATAGQTLRQGVRGIRGEGFDLSAIPKEAASSLAMEGIFRGAGKLAKPVINRLMIGAIKPAKDVLKRSPKIGNEAADLGLFGSSKTIGKKAEKIISKTTPEVDALLSGKKQRINALKIASELDSLKNPYDKSMNNAIQETQDAILRNADSNGLISVASANKEKQLIYRALKDSSWGKGAGEVPAMATVRKGAAHGFKENIEQAVPEVVPLNKNLSTAFGVSEGVDKQMMKNWMKPILPFVETVGGVGGLVTGNPWLTMAILARRAAQSPAVLSRTAQALTNKPLRRAATLGASEISRRMFGDSNS